MLQKTNELSGICSSRRFFLKRMACGAAVAMTSVSGVAMGSTRFISEPRKLAFHNLHTNEKLSLTYFERGQYVSSALQDLDYLLRDHRSGDVHNMDPELFDVLYDLQNGLGGSRTFQIISGYRSPATNHLLQKKSSGVASKSLHMQGKAMDIRIHGVDTRLVQQLAIALQRGGVGYYHKSNFVHIDTGRVRYW